MLSCMEEAVDSESIGSWRFGSCDIVVEHVIKMVISQYLHTCVYT